jgi:hypothetical protein
MSNGKVSVGIGYNKLAIPHHGPEESSVLNGVGCDCALGHFAHPPTC